MAMHQGLWKYLLRFQHTLENSLALMKPAKPINLVLVFTTHFVVRACAGYFVFLRELVFCYPFVHSLHVN